MSKIYTKIISFWDITFQIRSNQENVIIEIEKSFEIAGIPIFYKECQSEYQGPALSIINDEVSSITFDGKSEILELRIPWHHVDKQLSTIKNLIGQMISYVSWANKIFPIHSASISKNNQTILLLGNTGSGKTNLSYVLTKFKDYQWLGNDWIGISNTNNEVSVEKGFDLINFSILGYKELIEHGFIDELPYLSLQNSNPSLWSKTQYFHFEELEIIPGVLPKKVHVLLFLNITRDSSYEIEKIPPTIAINLILKELFWPLRGCGSFIIDNQNHAVVPSLVLQPKLGWYHACSLANAIIDSCKIFHISGSLNSIFTNFGIIESNHLHFN
jgi:hypothetical protein